MQTKSDNAMSHIQKEQELFTGLVDLWVSDMCLSDFEDQVNTFLQATKLNILTPNASFLLTLKCTTSSSNDLR